MIRKYIFGNPLNTGATVPELPCETEPMPYFSLERNGSSITFRISLGEGEILFGLGEQVRGMNKRGHRYESWNSDVFNHTEDKGSLYGSHNLLVFFSPDRCFALYLDDPGRVIWDLGYSCRDTAEITSENGDLSAYLIEEKDLKETARAFRRLTGRSYIPPRWAFGYIQSRWGYASEEEIRRVADEHRKRHIPLDGICMDIDYMDGYRNFTWNRDAFPDLCRFTEEMRGEHIRLIPIIDAGIKLEEKYPPYDTGKERGAFCKKENGDDFVAAVWPGRCCFPDFLREDVRAWFGDLYRPLLEAGIDGFWNDMNEPALFYSDETLAAAYERADGLRSREMSMEEHWMIQNAFGSIANNPEDYRRFYHRCGGRTVRHDRVHNLYGASMTRASAEGMARFDPLKRHLLFSRSSFIGAHRYGGIWQGDNFSWWSHLKLALQMLPNLNLCGFLFCGCDLGGFGCNTTEDLLERFLQLGVFTPLMRNHSALHTREQEIWRFSSWEIMRDTVTVRYALLPYLYSEFMKAALNDGMYFRPLAFDWPEDPRAVHTEDQLLLGDGCMIAPVYEQNACGRYVYLPEDMLLVRFRSSSDFDLVPLARGDHYVELKLNEFPMFVRRGRLVPLCPGGEYSEELDDTVFRAVGWTGADGAACCTLYRDDGITPDPVFRTVTLKAEDGLLIREIRLTDPA